MFSKSRIPGAGTGVFARVDLRNRTVVGYFNGVHLPKSQVSKLKVYLSRLTIRDQYVKIP